MIQGNGRSIATRAIHDEHMTPEVYHHNGDFLPDQSMDRGRQPRDSSVRHELRFPSDLELHHGRGPRDQPESHIPVTRFSSGKYPYQHSIPTRDQRPSESGRHLGDRTSGQENSNSSSGEQRYLEQSEISQRPESVTPEQKHRSRSREAYHESDSDVDDIMHIPTVSFLLTERGEPVEVRPGGAERSLRIKPQQIGQGSSKDTKPLSMSIVPTSEDAVSIGRKRIIPVVEDEPRQKHFGREEIQGPVIVSDEREKERYLFGGKATGKARASSSRSSGIEAARSGRFEGISQSPSPDVGHWRYDSRDANLVRPEREMPSSPSDPGFVRHTAHNWPDSSPRTPSQSPVDSVTPGGSRIHNWADSGSRTPSQSPQNWSESGASLHQGPDSLSRTPSQSAQDMSESTSPSSHHVHWLESHQLSDEGDYAGASPPPPPSKPPALHHQQSSSTRQSESKNREQAEEEEDDVDEDMPAGGSLTTQLLQKWLKQRKSKVGKSKSNP
jgi:hypothetical protein